MASKIHEYKLDWAMLLATAAAVAVAGLIPHGNFANNWVTWNPASRHTEFGSFGLASGPVALHGDAWHAIKLTLELAPSKPITSRYQILVQIDSKGSEDPLIIGQWKDSFSLMRGRDYANKTSSPRVWATLRDESLKPIVLEFVISPEESYALLDGKTVSASAPVRSTFIVPPDRITVGNSPNGTQEWAGAVTRLSIDGIDVTGTHTQPLADYRFDLPNLPVVVNDVLNDAPLRVPKPGRFPDKRHIEFKSISTLLAFNKRDMVINIAGLVPFGIALASVMTRRQSLRNPWVLALAATGVGALVGLTIESIQPLIPGRSPNFHDLLLNALGTGLGAAVFIAIRRIWVASRPQPLASHAPD